MREAIRANGFRAVEADGSLPQRIVPLCGVILLLVAAFEVTLSTNECLASGAVLPLEFVKAFATSYASFHLFSSASSTLLAKTL